MCCRGSSHGRRSRTGVFHNRSRVWRRTDSWSCIRRRKERKVVAAPCGNRDSRKSRSHTRYLLRKHIGWWRKDTCLCHMGKHPCCRGSRPPRTGSPRCGMRIREPARKCSRWCRKDTRLSHTGRPRCCSRRTIPRTGSPRCGTRIPDPGHRCTRWWYRNDSHQRHTDSTGRRMHNRRRRRGTEWCRSDTRHRTHRLRNRIRKPMSRRGRPGSRRPDHQVGRTCSPASRRDNIRSRMGTLQCHTDSRAIRRGIACRIRRLGKDSARDRTDSQRRRNRIRCRHMGSWRCCTDRRDHRGSWHLLRRHIRLPHTDTANRRSRIRVPRMDRAGSRKG